jgi:hypothetical protein
MPLADAVSMAIVIGGVALTRLGDRRLAFGRASGA